MALPAQPNQSLMHGLACLQAVVAAENPVGSRELARRLGLEHTRVHRLLGTLCHLGMLERSVDRTFRPGPGIHLLSAQSLRGSGLLAAALPLLRPFADERLIVSLGVLWDQVVCYLVRAEPGQTPEAAIGAHDPHPAHRSILGLALLAALPDKEVRRRLTGPPLGLGKPDLRALKPELAATRTQGYALRRDAGDHAYALAFPVGDPPVAAVGLTGIRRKRDATRLARQLGRAAEQITARLGDGAPSN